MAARRELPSVEDVRKYYSGVGKTLKPVSKHLLFKSNKFEKSMWVDYITAAVNWSKEQLRQCCVGAAPSNMQYYSNCLKNLDGAFSKYGTPEYAAYIVAYLIEKADVDVFLQSRITSDLLREKVDVLGNMISRDDFMCVSAIETALEEDPRLLNLRGKRGWALIHYACLHGNTHALNFLIRKDANVNLDTSKGANIFECASAAKKNKQEIKHILFCETK